MSARRLIIAIDGPAGAGKSTVAQHLAARFGLLNLETGAMYRAFALKALERAVDVDDAVGLEALARETSIQLEPAEPGNRVLLDGAEVTGRLREAAVTAAASRVSVHPPVRAWMVEMQRAMGATTREGAVGAGTAGDERSRAGTAESAAGGAGVVMEGRDIGTVVFPDADLKFFLDASQDARSERRQRQTGGEQSGGAATGKIAEEMRQRDARDRTRAVSPLRPAEDAIVIDSTSLTLDEVIECIEERVLATLSK
jgi:cytidylate kinase